MKTDYAIKLFGSIKALAESLGITAHAIYQWGEFVPELRVYQIREIKKIPSPKEDKRPGLRSNA